MEQRTRGMSQRPSWDDAPAPIPAPRDLRPAMSTLLMPDPEEGLRAKLARSRRAAAGLPEVASAARDEVTLVERLALTGSPPQ